LTDIDPGIRGLRVIHGAMMASVVGVSAIAVLVRTVLELDIDGGGMANLLLGVAGLLALTGPAAWFAIQRSVRAELQPKATAIRTSAEPLLGVLGHYRRLVLLRAALADAPALLGAISYLAGGSVLGLLFPAASLVLLLATVPSRGALERFLEGLQQ
jgi:hypothetical protein